MDHLKLVKFTGLEDVNFKSDVAPVIKEYVHSALDRHKLPTKFPLLSEKRKTSRLAKLFEGKDLIDNSYNLPYFDFEESHNPIHGIDGEDASTIHALGGPNEQAVDEFIRSLERRCGRLPDASDASIAGTCEWIVNKSKYQNWVQSTKNDILLVEGGLGYGKSCLAKFLITRLQRSLVPTREITTNRESSNISARAHPISSDSPIVLYFISRKSDEAQDPQLILLDLLAQIAESHPRVIAQGYIASYAHTSGKLNETLLWEIFNFARRKLHQTVFCVIDGLDECIDDMRSKGQTTMDQ